MNETDWQGIAIDRGRTVQHGATQYIELAYPTITDAYDKVKLVCLCIEKWTKETDTTYSKIRREQS
ncbi:MAG: hypothetical protein DRR42_09865 [Gammaproteobacteria bacterium]|nr:MAG: hypothetical protein DRR42_09865 [Gammaproteobacteria bacterium]